MTAPEYVLRKLLLGADPVKNLVGDRIGPRGEQAPKDKPYIAYFKVSDGRGFGLNLQPLAWRKARVQLVLVAESHAGVKALEDAVTARLQGFQGQVDDVYVEACFVDDASDDPENPAPNETGEFRVNLDAILTPAS